MKTNRVTTVSLLGMASLLMSCAVGYSQPLWTFDTSASPFSGNAAGDHTAMNLTWSAAFQSPLSGAGGGVQGVGTLGPNAGVDNWTRAQTYIGASYDASSFQGFTFDLRIDSTTPKNSTGQLPYAVIWFQWGITGPGDNSGNNVPYWLQVNQDNDWHTYTIPAQDLVGTPTFSAYMHTISFGLGDTHYTASTTVTAEWDNLGFAQPVPEPGSLLLAGLGALALGLGRVYRRRRLS